MITTQYRAQLATDTVTQVIDGFTDSDGAYQIALGFDAQGNEIRLSNRGFTSWPNYKRTIETQEERAIRILGALIEKRQNQMASWAVVDTREGRGMVRMIMKRMGKLIMKRRQLW